MSRSALRCPDCDSSNVRRSRRQTAYEFAKMAMGVYPFRCLACTHRFWVSIWLWSAWKYAKCPKCLGLHLVLWPRRSYHLNLRSKLLLTMGAHPYRCSQCRCNFVSFRPLAPASMAPDADLDATDNLENAR
jgi:DNA-directed RNA polymerase subunit RPC12/RpoP